MKYFVYFFLLTFYSLIAQTNIPGGNVSGTWNTAGSPYNITGDITVPVNEALVIEPGVTINFTGSYKLIIMGKITASGTPQDFITFTCPDTAVGWKGIRFPSTSAMNDSSIFEYCTIEGGKNLTGTGDDTYGGGVFIRAFSKVRFSDCVFRYNKAVYGGGISVRDNVNIIIENSEFYFNQARYSGAAIRLHDYSHSYIRYNKIYDNSGSGGPGIYIYRSNPLVMNNYIYNNVSYGSGGAINLDSSSPEFINNIITGNSAVNGGAVYFAALSNPVFTNNTIADNSATNGGALYFSNSSNPTFTNCVVWGNTASWGTQVYLANNLSDPNFLYCFMQHGTLNFYGDGSGMNYTGTYDNNIEVDPQFTGSGEYPYSLSFTSPGNNSGKPDVTGLNLPSIDLAGNPRIDSDTIDIGCYEYQGYIPVELVSFTAEFANESVVLQWITATELNNKGFEIYRKNNSGGWEYISFEKGKGTTTVNSFYSFRDLKYYNGMNYYKLVQIDYDGTKSKDMYAEVNVSLPLKFVLEQNYPNPFNPSTTIKYSLPEESLVSIIINDILGREVTTLVNEEKPSGTYELTWNASNYRSGVYFCKMQAGRFSETRKLILMK